MDSADIFADAIIPILQSKCVSCHNAKKKKGKLILNSFEEILKGGEDGPGIIPGNPEKSEIYRRITLPPEHKDFMPTNGKKPLTDKQVSIIKWWIEIQAPKAGIISSLKPDSAMKKIFTVYFGINNNNNSTLNITAPAADRAVIEELTKQGFLIVPLAEKSNLLKATLNGVNRDKVDINRLVELKEQIVWLQITNSGQLDEDLKFIGQLTNLRKLNLNNNIISDTGIKQLLSLSNLEYINLYGTQVSDSGVISLMNLKSLKRIYAWETKVSDRIMDSLSLKYPQVRIIYKNSNNEKEILEGS